MNASLERCAEHVLRRETTFGRWMPAILYLINVGGTAATAGATDLLYLVILPLPAVMLYLWRTAKRHP